MKSSKKTEQQTSYNTQTTEYSPDKAVATSGSLFLFLKKSLALICFLYHNIETINYSILTFSSINAKVLIVQLINQNTTFLKREIIA